MDRTFQERTWNGWKKAARILAVSALLLAMTACAGKGPSTEEPPAGTTAAVEETAAETTTEPATAAEEPASDADTAGYAEKELAVVSQAAKVNLYEITDNNFIQGIDERYDGKILSALKEAVKTLTFAEGVATPDDREAKYHIIFINEDGNYLMDILVGESGPGWCDDGVFQSSEILDDWISARIQEAEE